MDNSNNTTKICKDCGVQEDEVEFATDRGRVINRCRPCHAEKSRRYRREHPEAVQVTEKKRHQKRYPRERKTILLRNRQWDIAHPEIRSEIGKRHKDKKKQSRLQENFLENLDLSGSKICTQCDTEKKLTDFYPDILSGDGCDSMCKACACQKVKLYRQKNWPKVLARMKAWVKANPDKRHASDKKKRAARAHPPINDLTHAQWLFIQEVYDHRCAYCRKRAKGHLTQDHITPLSRGGSHTLQNVIPACRSCNSRKQAGPVLCPVQPLLLSL